MFTCDILVILQYRYKSVTALGSFKSSFQFSFWNALESRNTDVTIGFGRGKIGTRAIFLALFYSFLTPDRSSFFAPKPHGNAWYTDYRKNICNCWSNHVLRKLPVKCLTEPQGKFTALEYVGWLINLYPRSRVQVSSKSWIFSGSLRNCINCVHEDHSSFDLISAVLMWFISYTVH